MMAQPGPWVDTVLKKARFCTGPRSPLVVWNWRRRGFPFSLPHTHSWVLNLCIPNAPQMSTMKLKSFAERLASSQSPWKPAKSPWLLCRQVHYSKSSSSFALGEADVESGDVPTAGISRSLSEILKVLNKKVPDSLVRQRLEDGSSIKYIPW